MTACTWKFELAGPCYSNLTTITAHEPQAAPLYTKRQGLACADFWTFVTPRGLKPAAQAGLLADVRTFVTPRGPKPAAQAGLL